MAQKIGLDAKLYRNDGTYESPDWVEIKKVKEVTLNVEKGQADLTTRDNDGWRVWRRTIKDASVEFMLADDPEDENFEAIRDGFFNDTAIEFAIMNGDIDTVGSEGLRATMAVLKFSRPEPLEEGIFYNIEIKPTPATNAPDWYEVEAS